MDVRKFEIGTFELGTEEGKSVVELSMPADAVLYQIVTVDNKLYAVFVKREIFAEELSGVDNG